jgi:hypothetical protein
MLLFVNELKVSKRRKEKKITAFRILVMSQWNAEIMNNDYRNTANSHVLIVYLPTSAFPSNLSDASGSRSPSLIP